MTKLTELDNDWLRTAVQLCLDLPSNTSNFDIAVEVAKLKNELVRIKEGDKERNIFDAISMLEVVIKDEPDYFTARKRHIQEIITKLRNS